MNKDSENKQILVSYNLLFIRQRGKKPFHQFLNFLNMKLFSKIPAHTLGRFAKMTLLKTINLFCKNRRYTITKTK